MTEYNRQQRFEIKKRLQKDPTALQQQLQILKNEIHDDTKQLEILKVNIKTISQLLMRKILLFQELRQMKNGN